MGIDTDKLEKSLTKNFDGFVRLEEIQNSQNHLPQQSSN